MEMNKILLVGTMVACQQEAVVEEAMPIEIIECTHPDSRFEAVVQIEIEDNIIWESIYFEISQGSNYWEAPLDTSDSIIWKARMQLYELDCYEDFNYSVIYGEDQQ